MKTAPHLFQSLVEFFDDGVVVDALGKLPVHATKTYRVIDMAERVGLCFHHAAGWASIEDYARMHVEERGWPGVAYSMVIEGDGRLVVCHDLDVRTYAQGWKDDGARPETLGDENALWLGVLVNGFFASADYGYDKGAGEPSAEQLATVLQLAAWARREGLGNITGHYAHGKPACPGTTLETIIRALRFNDKGISETAPARAASLDLDTIVGQQIALAELSYYQGNIDGDRGDFTIDATRRFQLDNGIESANVVFGPRTKAAIRAAYTEARKG